MRLRDKCAPRRAVSLTLDSELIAGARLAAEQFKQEIRRSVVEHDAYLDEYGSLADATRAMVSNAG